MVEDFRNKMWKRALNINHTHQEMNQHINELKSTRRALVVQVLNHTNHTLKVQIVQLDSGVPRNQQANEIKCDEL